MRVSQFLDSSIAPFDLGAFFSRYVIKDNSIVSAYYDIKDRSFLTKMGRYYTEIHHCISVGSDKQLDVLENLTKLCPVCHRALKKGASSESYQKQLINNIFTNNPQNLKFASIIFASDDRGFLIDKVYQSLL